MRSVVCNASPLIALFAIHHFSLLTTIFDSVFVPDAVIQEVTQAPDLQGSSEVQEGLSHGDLTRYTIQTPTVVERLYGRLHRGELEVIIGAMELEIAHVILDDRSARQFATQLRLAHHRGLITTQNTIRGIA